MTVDADNFAPRDLLLQLLDRQALDPELADVSVLLPNVVELEYDQVALTAIGTGMFVEKLGYECSRLLPTATLRLARLAPVHIPTRLEVRPEAVSTPCLTPRSELVELVDRECAFTLTAPLLSLILWLHRPGTCVQIRSRDFTLDIPGPSAH